MSSASAAVLRAAAPAEDNRFAAVRDRYGWRLALVFGNEAEGGICPYYRAGRCHHCDIGAGEGSAFDRELNEARLAWFERHYAARWPDLAHLVVYNSGSTLNANELSRLTLAAILAFARRLPRAGVVSFDSREPYVNARALDALAAGLRDDQTARPILGLETADDHRRDVLLEKRMPRVAVERAFAALGAATERHGARRFGVDVNLVVAGPGVVDEAAAAADAAATARYVYQLGARHGVSVDLNIHPYYPSERSRARFPEHPRCSLTAAVAALRALVAERDAASEQARGGIFVGWEDEGHDTQQRVRDAELSRAQRAFARFNATLELGALVGLAQ